MQTTCASNRSVKIAYPGLSLLIQGYPCRNCISLVILAYTEISLSETKMGVLTDEAKEGLSQLSVGALGDGACAFCILGLDLPDDSAGWILSVCHEFRKRILVLDVDHWSQALMREISLHQQILSFVSLLAWTGQQLVQGVCYCMAVFRVRANCSNSLRGLIENIERKYKQDLQHIWLPLQLHRPFRDTPQQGRHTVGRDS